MTPTRLAISLVIWAGVEAVMQPKSARSRLDTTVLYLMRIGTGTQLAYAVILTFVVAVSA